MLKPRNTATREAVSLDGVWDFALDRENLGDGTEVAVPASVNDLFHDQAIRDHVGEYWFRRVVRVPRGWDGDRISLRFGSVTHESTVYVDGEKAGSHAGGYLPFEVDVTDRVRAGEEFVLEVVADNRLSNATIPPGEVKTLPDGRLYQEYKHDFFNYAGIHRTVHLLRTPKVRVEDVVIVAEPDLAAGTASVTWTADVSGGDADVRVSVLDASGAQVAAANGASGTLVLADVTLWRPGAGYLYSLVVEVLDGGEVVDSYPEDFGVRSVEVDGTRFLINGEPFYFTGFGMHEDHETLGKGHSNAHMVQDFQLLDWINANSLRTSHYPYAEEVMDWCDRHGVVVIDETAAVGLNWNIAGGIMGDEHGDTYAPGRIDGETQKAHRREIAELVARDKNRPSVVLWSIANEPDTAVDAALDYFAPLVDLTRELDPTRPVGFVNVMFAPAGVDTITHLFDVIMVNRYYGWYANISDFEWAERHLREELEKWVELYGKPIIVTEYGADTVAGLHSVYRQPFTEDFQVEFLKMYSRVFDAVDAVVGEQMWNFADFQTKYGVARVDGNRKGAFTRDRRPKAAATWLRDRWARKLGR